MVMEPCEMTCEVSWVGELEGETPVGEVEVGVQWDGGTREPVAST